MIDLDLHNLQDLLVTKKEKGIVYILCAIRKKYLIFQPEEMVRQLLIQYLIRNGYPAEKIQVEKGIDLNGLYRRFDIVIYDQDFNPFLLIECKSHTVSINQDTFDQIAAYNFAVKAPYLMVCNGVQTYCSKVDFNSRKINHLTFVPPYIF